jgi:hypothetical protein
MSADGFFDELDDDLSHFDTVENNNEEGELQKSNDIEDGLWLTKEDVKTEREKREKKNNTEGAKLIKLKLLILKYLSENPTYSERNKYGTLTNVKIDEIRNFLADPARLKQEILGYISLENKFTESQLKDFEKENSEIRHDKTSAKMIDGNYDKYNSIFYIQLTSGGNFIIYYLNAEKYCLNVNYQAFFIKLKEFIEHMTEVLQKLEKIDFKTFENYRIVINKLDKFKKGTGRRGRCFSERDDEIENIRFVLKEIKDSYTTTVGGRKSKKRKTYKRKTYKRKTYKRKTYKRKTYKRKKNRT